MEFAREIRRLKRWKEVWGLSYYCPFCHKPLSRFMPAGLDVPVLYDRQVIGGGYRQNARCLVCGSMDRERLIYLYLKKHTNFLQNNSKVLHIAPEPLLMRNFRTRKNLMYLTADLKSPRADIKLDITALPFGDDTFDLIIVNHVFEHVPDDAQAMKEVFRVLKAKTGLATMQVPISLNHQETFEDDTIDSDEDRLRVFGQEDHIRIYGQDYSTKLKQAGFTVQIFDWKNDNELDKSGNNKYGLIEHEKLYLGRKIAS